MNIITIKSNFAEKLREVMNKNPVTGESVSVQKLANFLNVTVQAVYSYLSGKTYPEYTQLIAIAGYFGVTTDYLLTGTRHENIKLRESLHLSDAAINNLESCDKELAPFVDKLLSDKDFFTEYKAVIKSIQDTRKEVLTGWRFRDLQKFCKGIILGGFARMSVFFEKFLSRLVKAEILTQATKENELTENDLNNLNKLPDNLKNSSQLRFYGN